MTARASALRLIAATLAVVAVLYGVPAAAQTPTYSLTVPDAITGDNATQNFTVPGVSCTGCRLPDVNGTVDQYTNDIYERPTSSGSSANVFFAALDITSNQVGFDATYLYYRINLYGNDTVSKPLPYLYAFEINFDADSRGDLLVRSEDPSGKLGGTFGNSGVIAFWDQNNNWGDGTITGPNGPGAAGGGYETLAFDQGTNNAPGRSGQSQDVVARVVAGPAIELAVKRAFLDALKGSAVTSSAFRPYAAKSGSTTSANTQPLHDEYGRRSAGSPYPWLAQAGAPASCPNTAAAESALTAAQRAALDSGTNAATAFSNPCYPSGGNIVEMDNGGTVGELAAGITLFFTPITVAKSFAPASIGTSDASVLTITLTNPNAGPVNGVSFTDTYPAGLVNTGTPAGATICTAGTVTAAGNGGSVVFSGGTVPASGSCTVTVNVTSAAVGSYLNSTGAVSTANAGTAAAASATLTVRQHPQIAKSFSPDAIAPGTVSRLTITLTNPNAGAALTAAAFTDTFPTTPGQMTIAMLPLPSNTCGGALSENDALDGDTTLEAGDGSIRLSGGTIPAGGSCAISVNVTASAGGIYTNTIAAGGLTTANAGANTTPATATLTVLGAVSLTVVKSSAVHSDPINLANPRRIPGGFVTYNIVTTSSGAGSADSDTIVATDPIPPGTDLFVGDVGAPGSGPVAFTDGNPSSGLTYTFISLASGADDVSFSNDGGVTYTYTPVPDGNGVNANVTHIRISPKGTFAGDPVAGAPSPSFSLSFRVRIE